ncbi:hypothetical protein V1514DRAFT_337399 [Lipomyces japonicus]|uniref:uncharacterized protein n=1 Tax=Lipomyces japonicus TaxID=56871 RepID=UPI0034CF6687
MSIQRFATLISHWPQDALKRPIDIIPVLRQQLELRQKGEDKGLQKLDLQVKLMDELLNNTYKTRYPLTDKLLRPAGKPDYYQALQEEIKQGSGTPTLWDRVKVYFTN